MSEELFQRDFIQNLEKIGKWNFYNMINKFTRLVRRIF